MSVERFVPGDTGIRYGRVPTRISEVEYADHSISFCRSPNRIKREIDHESGSEKIIWSLITGIGLICLVAGPGGWLILGVAFLCAMGWESFKNHVLNPLILERRDLDSEKREKRKKDRKLQCAIEHKGADKTIIRVCEIATVEPDDPPWGREKCGYGKISDEDAVDYFGFKARDSTAQTLEETPTEVISPLGGDPRSTNNRRKRESLENS